MSHSEDGQFQIMHSLSTTTPNTLILSLQLTLRYEKVTTKFVEVER